MMRTLAAVRERGWRTEGAESLGMEQTNIDKVLDILMGVPKRNREATLELAKEIADMATEQRQELEAWMPRVQRWATKYPRKPIGDEPQRKPRKRAPRQVGSVTNVADA